jgi:CheY-like chemotaxis protein
MPVLDGITATKMIRQNTSSLFHPYIIALTANVVPEVKDRCLKAGMNDFISKPFKLKELLDVLITAEMLVGHPGTPKTV